MARGAIRKGIEDGRNPRSVALDLVGRINPATKAREGGFIGLTRAQQGYAENARDELRQLDRAYLDRGLRDKRFDRSVLAAIKAGKPLSETEITRIVGRYSDRLLEFRGDAIARTESLNALRAGRHEGHLQVLDSGKVQNDQIERVWDTTIDGRQRDDHAAMNGQTVMGLFEPFTAPDGSRLMFPGDTSLGAGADQVINCRCFASIRIDFLKGLR